MDIGSELRNNPGGSVANSADVIAAEVIAAGMIRATALPTLLVWIEHWPEESAEGQETFYLPVFSNYEVTERAPYLGESRAWIGDATWKPLDRASSMEVLVGRCEQTGSVKRKEWFRRMVVTLLSEGRVTSHGMALFAYSPKVKEGVFCRVQAPRLRASMPQAVAQYPEH